jgi:hypothetical protein
MAKSHHQPCLCQATTGQLNIVNIQGAHVPTMALGKAVQVQPQGSSHHERGTMPFPALKADQLSASTPDSVNQERKTAGPLSAAYR